MVPDIAESFAEIQSDMATAIVKRVILVLVGPVVFLFLAIVPTICGNRRGYRGWYWRTVSRSCSVLLWFLDIRVQISDAARDILAADKSSIIAVNHRSHLDGFALLDAIPQEKWVTFGAKRELCQAFLLRRGFVGAGLVEIDRQSGKKALETIKAEVQAMPARRSVILFVEGTRAKTPGLAPFKAGAVLAARATGRSVRPIVISGSDQILPHGKILPRTGTIRIDVLTPLEPNLAKPADDDVTRLRKMMVAAFEAATGEKTSPTL